ncbi:MAG: ATP-binding protein [Anaerolineae bacterium]|nr:ATP-binding protein [Anaerolineae bacterium]
MIPDDLTVLETETVFDGDRLDYIRYRMVEREGGCAYPVHRVVRLAMLRYLPAQTQSDPAILLKMQAALAGFYKAHVVADLVYLAANMVSPPVGIVQCYGVVSVADTLDAAVDQSRLGMEAFKSTLADFRQIVLAPLDAEITGWLMKQMKQSSYTVTVVGHADPRENPRRPEQTGQAFGQQSQGRDGAHNDQQIEKLFRGMLNAGHEFVFMALASRVPQDHLARLLAGLAEEASVWKSRQSGTKAISFNLAVPITLSAAVSRQAALGYTEQESHSLSRSIGASRSHTTGTSESETVGGAQTWSMSHSVGRAHTEGVAHTQGVAYTEGVAHTDGAAHTEGQSESWGESHSVGTAKSHSETSSWSDGVAESHGVSSGSSWGVSSGESVGTSWGAGSAFSSSHAEGAQSGWSAGQSAGGSQGMSESAAHSTTVQGNVGVGIPGVVNIGGGASDGVSHGFSASEMSSWGTQSGMSGGESIADTTGQSMSFNMGGSAIHTSSQSQGGSSSESHGVTTSHTVGGAVTDSITNSEAWGTSHGVGVSQADTESHSDTRSASVTHSSATTHSSSDTVSEGWTEGYARSSSWANTKGRSEADTLGISAAAAAATGQGTGLARSQGAGRVFGFAGGVVPSLGASKTYQWVDDRAVLVGELLTTQERLLTEAVVQGGYLTDVYALLPNREAVVAFETLVRQAFIGTQGVATAVQPRYLAPEEQEYVHLHACAFTPATMEEKVPGLLEGYRHTTLLPPLMLSAYTAPAVFEEGLAIVSQEEIPRYAFYGEMGLESFREKGAILGRQWSNERGALTVTPLVLTTGRHFHSIFQGDTGMGKSEAAMRLALESAMKFHHPVLVFEFGSGWRGLFNSPLPRERFEIYQLYPGAPRPLRWPILRVPRRIHVDDYIANLVQIIANAGGMGERQIGLMQQALRQVYLKNGVPIESSVQPVVPGWGGALERKWAIVRREEESEIGVSAGTRLQDLTPEQRQRLIIVRSGKASVGAWVNELLYAFTNIRNNSDQQALSGAINRLERLTRGELAGIIGPVQHGERIPAIEELHLIGPPGDEWGVTVIEGSNNVGAFVKSVLFGLMLWTIYTDRMAVVRSAQVPEVDRIDVFIEEANKVLCGVEQPDGSRPTTPALFEDMWRDSRKAFYLHPITQTISALSSAILASCANAFIFQSKNTDDVGRILTHLARSDKGMHDLPHVHHIPRLEVGTCITRLGVSMDREKVEMTLMRPRMVAREMPSDEDLFAWYGQPNWIERRAIV